MDHYFFTAENPAEGAAFTDHLAQPPVAVKSLRKLPAHIRAEVKDALELHLRHEPTKVSKSRIKRLRGLSQPQFRLRVGDIRVFYDVTEATVEVLAIIGKAEAQVWLDREGTPTSHGGSR